MPRIISISRRTDIPAFHGDWFMARLAQGFAGWENPFAGQKQLVSLRREDVACLAFWSKNYHPFLPHLRQLKAEGWPCFFNFTITGLPNAFEPCVPPAAESVETFKEIATLFSPAHILWRYDPVLLSEWTPPEYHLARFAALAGKLAGSTTRCVISFPTRYEKVARNFARFETKNACRIFDPTLEERRQLAAALADIAAQHNMVLQSCCDDSLVSDRITKAHCIDGETISRLYGCACRTPARPNRPQCGCAENVDIGRYNTCPHGCIYCYANTGQASGFKCQVPIESSRPPSVTSPASLSENLQPSTKNEPLGPELVAEGEPRTSPFLHSAFFGRTEEESNRFLAELRATELPLR